MHLLLQLLTALTSLLRNSFFSTRKRYSFPLSQSHYLPTLHLVYSTRNLINSFQTGFCCFGCVLNKLLHSFKHSLIFASVYSLMKMIINLFSFSRSELENNIPRNELVMGFPKTLKISKIRKFDPVSKFF